MNKFLHITLPILTVVVLSCASSDNSKINTDEYYEKLKGEWLYRWGDSPVDSSGNLEWLNEESHSQFWKPVNDLNEIPIVENERSLWLRIKLPQLTHPGAGLSIGRVHRVMQIYIANNLLYQFGKFENLNDYHFQGWRHHIIPLPENAYDQILTFRIWSDGPKIGVDTPIMYGALVDISKNRVAEDIINILLVIIFLSFSVLLALLFFILGRDKLFIYMAFYLSTISFLISTNTSWFNTYINQPYLLFLLDYISLYSCPVASYLLLKEILYKNTKTIIERLWQVHLIFVIISLPVLLFPGKAYLNELDNLFLLLLGITSIVCTIVIFRNRKRFKKELKILIIGLLILFAAEFLDLLTYLSHGIESIDTFEMTWLPLGTLGFVVSIIWLSAYRYLETNKQKIEAQKENMEHVIQNERLKVQMLGEKLEAEKWQDLDKMKSRFLANISHEFRTPLTLILASSKQLIKENHNTVVTERSQMLERNGNQLLNHINQLLDLSKLDAGKLQLSIEEMDFIPFAKGIFYSFQSYAEQKDIKLEFETDIDCVHAFLDKDKMITVINNLVSNAIKFTPAGGTVTLSVSLNENLIIRVADTGVGIPEENLDQIFDRFYQADNNPSNHQSGTGIGLALTHELIKLHDGEIKVKSELNKGAQFTIQIPVGKEHFDKAEIKNSHMNTNDEPVGIRENVYKPIEKISENNVKNDNSNDDLPVLLIVEDNKDMRAYIKEELFDLYNIKEAENGRDGFDKAIHEMPDLIISDVMMPVMDGFKLCDKIKNDERTSHIPVILLTARSGMESRIEGLEQGADDYLVKPFSPEELKTRVKNLIIQRKKLRERFTKEINISFKEITATSADEKFLERAVNIIDSRLDDPNLSVEWFCKEMALSRSQMHRKFQALTNQSVSEFIRTVRLKRAVQLIETKSATISEIAYQTGFSSPDYFRQCFKEQFGCPPSEYRSK